MIKTIKFILLILQLAIHTCLYILWKNVPGFFTWHFYTIIFNLYFAFAIAFLLKDERYNQQEVKDK